MEEKTTLGNPEVTMYGLTFRNCLQNRKWEIEIARLAYVRLFYEWNMSAKRKFIEDVDEAVKVTLLNLFILVDKETFPYCLQLCKVLMKQSSCLILSIFLFMNTLWLLDYCIEDVNETVPLTVVESDWW